MPSRYELLHWRLQAILRDYDMPGLEYIGKRMNHDGDSMVHWYRIGKAEIPLDMITELETEEHYDEDEKESDTF